MFTKQVQIWHNLYQIISINLFKPLKIVLCLTIMINTHQNQPFEYYVSQDYKPSKKSSVQVKQVRRNRPSRYGSLIKFTYLERKFYQKFNDSIFIKINANQNETLIKIIHIITHTIGLIITHCIIIYCSFKLEL